MLDCVHDGHHPTHVTGQLLNTALAQCRNCGQRCDARNAQAWAHNHVRHHRGHVVDLALEIVVRAEASGRGSREDDGGPRLDL